MKIKLRSDWNWSSNCIIGWIVLSKQVPFYWYLMIPFFNKHCRWINELINLYQTLTSTQTLTPSLPWFKVTTELLEVALTRHVKQGVNVDINLGLLYHTLDFLKKVTTKLHRGTRASYSTAFPWRNIYTFTLKKRYHVYTTLWLKSSCHICWFLLVLQKQTFPTMYCSSNNLLLLLYHLIFNFWGIHTCR